MTAEERLILFEEYTNTPDFEYNDNGPDHWICPVCKDSTCVTYVQPGVREDTPSIDQITHYPDCPQNPRNKN